MLHQQQVAPVYYRLDEYICVWDSQIRSTFKSTVPLGQLIVWMKRSQPLNTGWVWTNICKFNQPEGSAFISSTQFLLRLPCAWMKRSLSQMCNSRHINIVLLNMNEWESELCCVFTSWIYSEHEHVEQFFALIGFQAFSCPFSFLCSIFCMLPCSVRRIKWNKQQQKKKITWDRNLDMPSVTYGTYYNLILFMYKKHSNKVGWRLGQS